MIAEPGPQGRRSRPRPLSPLRFCDALHTDYRFCSSDPVREMRKSVRGPHTKRDGRVGHLREGDLRRVRGFGGGAGAPEGPTRIAASFTPRSEASPGDTSASIIRKAPRRRRSGNRASPRSTPGEQRTETSCPRNTWRNSPAKSVRSSGTALSPIPGSSPLWRRRGEDCGLGSGGRNREGEADYLGELYIVYRLEGQQPRGLGTPSHLGVARELEKGGIPTMIAWVLRDNPASEFYRKLGGEPVASKLTIIFGSKTFEEVAYGWSDLPTLLQSA